MEFEKVKIHFWIHVVKDILNVSKSPRIKEFPERKETILFLNAVIEMKGVVE